MGPTSVLGAIDAAALGSNANAMARTLLSLAGMTMKRLVLLGMLLALVYGLSGESAASQPPGAHETFAVLGLKIGMPVEGQDGFKCAKAVEGQDRHCVKFLDKRCAGQKANIGVKNYGDEPPLGCFLDHSSLATYLDGELKQQPNTGEGGVKPQAHRIPLKNLHLVGTASKPSRIYRMRYMLEKDELTADSKLYVALTAKYGEPTYKNPPHDMRWKAENTELRAGCDWMHCWLDVSDSKFETIEERKQEEADAKARRGTAATPEL